MKKSLHEVLGYPGPLTLRHQRAWLAWLEWDWDRPSRADHYAMQTTREIRRYIYMKADMNPNEIQLANLKLASDPGPPPDEQAPPDVLLAYQTALSQQAALARMPGLVKEIPAPEVRPGEEHIVVQEDYSNWNGSFVN